MQRVSRVTREEETDLKRGPNAHNIAINAAPGGRCFWGCRPDQVLLLKLAVSTSVHSISQADCRTAMLEGEDIM